MNKTKDLTLLSIMTAIIIVMITVPGLGYIPLGVMNATIVHIPVIILAIVKGPKMGAILGFIFGLTSIVNNLLRPVLASYVFINPIVSILPRVLIGIVTGYVYILLNKTIKKKNLSIAISAGIGSLVNTIGVLSLVFIIYGQGYLEVTGRSGQTIVGTLLTIASTNGLAELVLAVLISTPIAIALLKIEKRGSR